MKQFYIDVIINWSELKSAKKYFHILEICKILLIIYKKILLNYHVLKKFNQECKKENDVFIFCNDIESKKSF